MLNAITKITSHDRSSHENVFRDTLPINILVLFQQIHAQGGVLDGICNQTTLGLKLSNRNVQSSRRDWISKQSDIPPDLSQ
jgi:hypothetical protein